MLHHQTTQAIKLANHRGLAYIASQQLKNGGFTSFSKVNPADFVGAKSYQTTFFPSLILSALGSCNENVAASIKHKAAKFLWSQKGEGGSFNYWDRQSRAAAQQPYPDDLDDTFCAFAALYTHDPKSFDGKLLAQIANLLVASEVDTGGPYRTWLVSTDAPRQWQDVDVVVNTNVARFLNLQDIHLPNITTLTERAIGAGSPKSSYYPDIFAWCYFLAAWYRGTRTTELIAMLVKQQKAGRWANPMQTALAISALIGLGYPATKLQVAVRYLVKSQSEDGSWPAAAFCIDPAQGGQRAYAGAPSLTTALCIEALSSYQQAMSKTEKRQTTTVSDRHTATVHSAVANVIKALPADLQASCLQVLERVTKQDTDQQIARLPWWVAQALGSRASEKTLRQLAVANLWGWMAYTVYDDFLDEEGEPHLLPAANVCLRNLLGTLTQTLPNNRAFHTELVSILNRLDAANAWEVTYCRGQVKAGTLSFSAMPDYADYWQLADRSVGHSIAALGVLYAHNKPAGQLEAMRQFFHHYLIARQLNDDLHDWEDDLNHGHINAVAAHLLRAQKINHRLGLGRLETLRQPLWDKVVPIICADILTHAQKARESLAKIRGFDPAGFEPLIRKPETAAQEALAGRAETLAFIKRLGS